MALETKINGQNQRLSRRGILAYAGALAGAACLCLNGCANTIIKPSIKEHYTDGQKVSRSYRTEKPDSNLTRRNYSKEELTISELEWKKGMSFFGNKEDIEVLEKKINLINENPEEAYEFLSEKEKLGLEKNYERFCTEEIEPLRKYYEKDPQNLEQDMKKYYGPNFNINKNGKLEKVMAHYIMKYKEE
jgi:hypothetical protein